MIGVILLAICVTISAVSADDGWSFNFSSSESSNSDGGSVTVENNKVNIQDIEFTIPDGYKEEESERIVGKEADQKSFPGAKISTVEFDKDKDSIIIKVVYADNEIKDSDYTPDDGAVEKQICNQKGYVHEHADGVSIDFVKDGKIVEVFAPDEQVLASLLK